MQDNMRINNPIRPNENTNNAGKLKSQEQMPLINPIETGRVNPKNSSEASKNDSFNFLLNHGSVYNRFIEQLAQTPALAETLKKIMFDVFAQAQKGVKLTGANAILLELAEKLKMNPDEIVEALKYQSENQTKYSGKMFDAFRAILGEHKGQEQFENLLGHFLKAYNGFFSSKDTLKAITQNLKSISDGMPKSYSKEIDVLIQKLIDPEITATSEKLTILKNEVIPFLSKYVSQTNDFGRVRDTITLLINNIARLNTSSKEDIINKFVDLLDFCKFQFDLDDKQIDYIKQQFAQKLTNPKTEENEMLDTMFKLISKGNTDEKSSVSRAIYRDVSNSLLLDNSVFMPLTHLFLPVTFQGKFMFTELWIDKDANRNNPQGDRTPITKLFVTFDIKTLGYFEATVVLLEKRADVEINCPSTLDEGNREVQNNIARIFANNGFEINSITTTKGEPNKKLSEVFPNMFDKRRGVDVTV